MAEGQRTFALLQSESGLFRNTIQLNWLFSLDHAHSRKPDSFNSCLKTLDIMADHQLSSIIKSAYSSFYFMNSKKCYVTRDGLMTGQVIIFFISQ